MGDMPANFIENLDMQCFTQPNLSPVPDLHSTQHPAVFNLE